MGPSNRRRRDTTFRAWRRNFLTVQLLPPGVAAGPNPRAHSSLVWIAPMERALAYVISAGIVGFGVWILIAGLSTIAPALWACAALIPIAIGLLSAFDEC